MTKAVCLISGGMDSAVSTHIAKDKGYELHLVFVDYGQKTRDKELNSAKKLSEYFGAKSFKILKIDWLKEIGGSALTDSAIEIPKGDKICLDNKRTQSTYVPFRNTILWSLATAYAETIGADVIYSGSEPDNANPDNSIEYLSAMQTVIYLGTKKDTKIKLMTPFKEMEGKGDIVKKGLELGTPFELTWSCYAPTTDKSCGKCEKCTRRLKAFEKAGVMDPIHYEK